MSTAEIVVMLSLQLLNFEKVPLRRSKDYAFFPLLVLLYFVQKYNLNLADGSWGINNLGQRLMEAQSPFVEAALRSTRESIRERLDTMSGELEKLEADMPEHDRQTHLQEIIEKTLNSV